MLLRILPRLALSLVTTLALFPSPSRAQAPYTEAEQERIGWAVAVRQAIRERSLRWSPDAFPLDIAFLTSRSIQDTACAATWRHRLQEQVDWLNAGGTPLVRLSFAQDRVLSGFLYFGSDPDFDTSPARALIRSWEMTPGIAADIGWSRGTPYWARFHSRSLTRFTAKVRFIAPSDGCAGRDAEDAVRALRELLLPKSIRWDWTLLEPYPRVLWHARRHLLTAMGSLPADQVPEEDLWPAWIKVLIERSKAAQPQPQPSDKVQDELARALAISAVVQHGILRWPASAFPLTIGLFFDPSEEQSECLPELRRHLEDYVRGVNGDGPPLLRASFSPDASFDALLYWEGDQEDFERSPSYRFLQARQTEFPELRKSPPPSELTFLTSPSNTLGFAAGFPGRARSAFGGCQDPWWLARSAAEALMPDLSWEEAPGAWNAFPENPDGWLRVQRRLLLALRSLPPGIEKDEDVPAAVVRALLAD